MTLLQGKIKHVLLAIIRTQGLKILHDLKTFTRRGNINVNHLMSIFRHTVFIDQGRIENRNHLLCRKVNAPRYIARTILESLVYWVDKAI